MNQEQQYDRYKALGPSFEREEVEHADTALLKARIDELEKRIKELENPKRLGPRVETEEERAAQVKYVEDFIKDAKATFAEESLRSAQNHTFR